MKKTFLQFTVLLLTITIFNGCGSSSSGSSNNTYDFWDYFLADSKTKMFDGMVLNSNQDIVSSYYGIIKHKDFKISSFGTRTKEQLMGGSDFTAYNVTDSNITSNDLSYKRMITLGENILIDTSIRECKFKEYKSKYEPIDGYVYSNVIILDCTFLGNEDYQIGYSKDLGIVYWSKPYNVTDTMFTLYKE
jgi:hypothetical protein